MKSVLKYPGAKNRLANWICSFIPDHEVYCEPFFGSGAVFFNKPKAKIETVNDLDGKVINYFRVIREHPAELARLLSLIHIFTQMCPISPPAPPAPVKI